MKAIWVPDRLTVVKAPDALYAIGRALARIEGREPAPLTVAIHGAQSALESGRWRSCHNWNLDNTKAGLTYEGRYQCYRCDEQLPDGWHKYLPEGELSGGWGSPLKYPPMPVPEGHPQTRFRAYESLEEGAAAHVRFERDRYPEAYKTAQYGDIAGFVHGLKQRRFFTADEAPYLRGVSSITREYLPLVAQPERDTIPAPADDDEQMICEAMACMAPDPERALHTEAVVAWMLSQDGLWDALAEEKKANLREPD